MLAVCAASVAAFAEDIAITEGRTLKDAKILSQSPASVMIKHAEGLSQVAKKVLPEALREKYPVDEAAALQAKARDAELRAAQPTQLRQRELRERQAREPKQKSYELVGVYRPPPVAARQSREHGFGLAHLRLT